MSSSWDRGKLKWINPNGTSAFAASEKSYDGDVLLHIELYCGGGPAFEGRQPGDGVLFSTKMEIEGKQVPKQWKWAESR